MIYYTSININTITVGIFMDRIQLREFFINAPAFDGKTVTVCGWAKTIRDSKSFGFIELNDGSYFKNCQIVFDREKVANYDEIAKLVTPK